MRSSATAILVSLAAFGLTSCDAREAAEGGGSGEPTTGAHTVHLEGPLARTISCGECHNGQFAVTLEGPLARANGAQGSFNSSTLTCSNVYCHDGGPTLLLGGGTVPAPVWNPPSTLGCGGCHSHPGDGTAATWHPAVAGGVECALCHPGFTNTTVNRELHVNGVANLTAPTMTTSCAACHGDANRVIPPGTPEIVKAAPPVDRNGASSPSLRGVGAHQRHVLPTTDPLSQPVACSECHAVPTDLEHVGPTATTPATVAWGTLASANGAIPTLVPPAPGGTAITCSNVYCHGGGPGLPLGGGTLTSPTWNPPSVVTCGTCHALPGGTVDTSAWHPAIAAGTDCGFCHDGYSRVSVNPLVHVNGLKDVRAPFLSTDCTACHGDPNRLLPTGTPVEVKAAPPLDRFGSSDTRQAGVGAHQSHLLPGTSAISEPVACAECHVIPSPDSLLHVGPSFSTPATLDWGPLATASGVEASYDRTAATCANYCHGATLTGGANTAPIWNEVNGTQARCGTCHGNPPTSGAHVQHAAPNWYGISCGVCHPPGYALGAVGQDAVPFHVNGVTNMNPVGFSDWNPAAPGPNGYSGTAIGCHGGTRYWTPGTQGSCQ